MSTEPGTAVYNPRAESIPIYKQSNIGQLQLLLSPEHWESPQLVERWCIQPGDVVVNKFSPLRAALVPPLARRHPVDGNSLIVRGLPQALATWLAVCLNRIEYQQLALIESGLLRRIGLGTLANLQLPPVPSSFETLSAELLDWLDESLLVGEGMHRTKAEAGQEAWQPESGPNLRLGAVFEGENLSNDNWLPGAVALRSWQAKLPADQGWLPLGTLASADDRARLQSLPEGARVLKLGDVGDDLFVTSNLSAADAASFQAARTLSKPLITGEVLLSTLGSSPRAAYVDEGASRNTFPTDNWARMRFRETPAAWALLLSTPTIHRQVVHLVVGTVQQFVPPQALLFLHLPTPDREKRDRWQHAVEHHHGKRRELERRWNILWETLMEAFDEVHASPRTRRSATSGTAGALP